MFCVGWSRYASGGSTSLSGTKKVKLSGSGPLDYPIWLPNWRAIWSSSSRVKGRRLTEPDWKYGVNRKEMASSADPFTGIDDKVDQLTSPISDHTHDHDFRALTPNRLRTSQSIFDQLHSCSRYIVIHLRNMDGMRSGARSEHHRSLS